MHAGKVKIKHTYKMDGQELSQIEKEKDLGVFINHKLSSSDQVVEVRKRALRMLGAINRNASYKSEEVITKLYCAYVRPHLEYCVQAWSPIYEKDCWLLERVQKRATKMVKHIKDLSYEERLKELGMFSLRYRRLRGDSVLVLGNLGGKQHPGSNNIPLFSPQIGGQFSTPMWWMMMQSEFVWCSFNFHLRIADPWWQLNNMNYMWWIMSFMFNIQPVLSYTKTWLYKK